MENLNIPALIFIGLGAIVCLSAFRLLWKYKLLSRFGLLLICVALTGSGVVFVMAGLDLLEYRPIPDGAPVAIVTLSRESGNQFVARIRDNTGVESGEKLTGDHWQISARVVRLNTQVIGLEMKPMVRLEYMRGLTLSVAGETLGIASADRSLRRSRNRLDVWPLLKKIPGLDRLIFMQMTTTFKQPVEDNAAYLVNLTNFGLVIERRLVGTRADTRASEIVDSSM